jgi:uncharacterized membrane protein
MDKRIIKSVPALLFTGLVVSAQQVVASDSRESRSLNAAGPGWTLDINNKNHKVNFETSEGTVSYKYPRVGPTVRDQGERIIYFVNASNHQMNDQVKNESCTDSAGSSFDNTVAVVLGGQGYWGCGATSNSCK